MIRAIWNNNRDDVMHRVASLEDAVASLIEGSLSPDTRLAAERDAHRLAGAAGTFGFRRASAAARELESILAGSHPIPLDRTLAAADEVVALRGDLSRDPDPAAGPETGHKATGTPAGGSPSGPSVVIDMASRKLRRQLTAAADGLGLTLLAPDADGTLPEGAQPAAAVVELTAGSGGLELISRLAALDPPVPALALAPAEAAGDRVAAVRAGARGFLSSTTPAADILAAVQGLMAPAPDPDSTVLVLDQLPRELSPAIGALLEAGLGVESVSDSAKFWAQLASRRPDLAILGTSAAGDDAAELCRALRSDPAWAALPVIVLADNSDAQAAAALFDAGADDVVSGLLDAAELAARVRNRISRARMLSAGPRAGQAADPGAGTLATGPDAGIDGMGAAPGAGYDVDVAVVEDDPLLADLLRHAVTTRGYRFRHFADGQAAADELAGATPALRSRVVLLDVDLPVLNGFGLLRQLAVTGRLSATRVIMLTAHSSEKEIVNALTLGAFDHVAKPFSVPVLMQRVDRAMGV